MLVQCLDTNFFDPHLRAHHKVLVKCGPDQYRFSVYDPSKQYCVQKIELTTFLQWIEV